LAPANKTSLLDPYEGTLGKCCIDPLRPPDFTGLESYLEALIKLLEENVSMPRQRECPGVNYKAY